MANEIITTATADITAYFIVMNSSGHVWQTTTSTFVAIVDANWANYDLPLVEQGTSSGLYVGDFPALITSAGTYYVFAYQRAGGTPVVSDTKMSEASLYWNGVQETDEPDPSESAWVSLADVKLYQGITSTTYDSILDDLRQQVCASIQGYIDGGNIIQDTFAELYSCSGTQHLKLRQRFEVTVSQLTFDYYDSNPQVIAGTNVWVNDQGTVRFKPSSQSIRYFNDLVYVEGTSGFAVIPADLTLIAQKAIKIAFDASRKDFNTKSESIGDYSYSLGDFVNDPLYSGIRDMLAGYLELPVL